jgi:hypothetical protein
MAPIRKKNHLTTKLLSNQFHHDYIPTKQEAKAQ